MRRINRARPRRRSNGSIRTLLAGLAAALSAAALPGPAATFAKTAGGPEAVQSGSHCDYAVGAPGARPPKVVSTTWFRCTSPHPDASVTVVMQRHSRGTWHTVASVTQPFDAQAGTKYTAQAEWRTPPRFCGAHPHNMDMRTHFTLKFGATPVIDYTTPGVKVFPCIIHNPPPPGTCNSPSTCGPAPDVASRRETRVRPWPALDLH
jgi:hypothetical protein